MLPKPTFAKRPVVVTPEEPLEQEIVRHLERTLARKVPLANDRDVYWAAALAVRDQLASRWAETAERYRRQDSKRVYYLSLEFLMGRTLTNALINLGLEGDFARAAERLGYRMEELQDAEPDAGLGNGGLGRLAACYLDSMATLGIPGYGYGIRYEHGIFKQALQDGRQVEHPDSWLKGGNPWEIARPERAYTVQFYGRVDCVNDPDGRVHFQWVDTRDVLALPYDTPIPGYRNKTVNTMRLWSAQATEDFDLEDFLRSDYIGAVHSKMESETISKVLYPPDDTGAGKELRLKQQFFFVSATLQDIIRRHLRDHESVLTLADKAQIQLNDTHPALAVPELMRLLMDGYGLEWEAAWDLTTRTCAYTNHTVLPEALETWSVDLVRHLLPRHFQIIEEIDRRFRLAIVQKFPANSDRVHRMSILGDGRVRMANLAIVGSHSVNGVAALHTEILKSEIFRDFCELWPDRFVNVTNGVTQRRWMQRSNPEMSNLITSEIGSGWLTDLEQLRRLEPLAEDPEFRSVWQRIKRANKVQLVDVVRRDTGIELDPDSMFDVQVKRIHEYKRQLLNALRLVDLYLELKERPGSIQSPRSVLFAGKAAPTYWTAKEIIHLINSIARLVNADPDTSDMLRVAYLPDYRVSLAQKIFPGSDLSEQISTAGYEASGTGNMKFALNGALTIGTLDGANVEIAELVGRENIFIFGLTADEVASMKSTGYCAADFVSQSPRLRRVLDFISSGALSPEEPGRFRRLVEALLHNDPYLLCADFDAYIAAQAEVDLAYQDQESWTRKAILNVARTGFFSSDRSITEYAQKIWKITV